MFSYSHILLPRKGMPHYCVLLSLNFRRSHKLQNREKERKDSAPPGRNGISGVLAKRRLYIPLQNKDLQIIPKHSDNKCALQNDITPWGEQTPLWGMFFNHL